MRDGRAHLVGDIACLLRQEFAKVADKLIAGIAHVVRVETSAGHAQRQNTDAECGERILITCDSVTALEERCDDFRIGYEKIEA